MRITVVTGSYPKERMGGAEYQTLLIAQGLADLSHDVVFLATKSDEGGEFEEGKIAVLKIPGWRTVGWGPHRQLVAKAIEESSPDICYVRRFAELATVVPLCNKAGVPVVSTSCHSRETSPFLLGYHPIETIAYLRSPEAILHLRSFLSIRSSAVHVCNTRSLQAQIQRWFPRKRIRMIYNGSPVPPPDRVHLESSGQVIWVNNLKRWKRPEIFIQLARRLPQFHFVMIGRMAGHRRYAQRLRAVLQRATANFQYLGPMPIDQVNAMISQSDLLVYTSLPVEGFGNSFIQAWFRGVPTVSLSFDLDGILEREGVGCCSRTFDQLVADVQELMTDDAIRRNMGQRAREYAIRDHSADRMVADYETLFKEVVGEVPRGDPP